MKIIFAQGNPESRFDGTRHNIGFAVIDQFALEQGASWSDKPKSFAMIAELMIDGEKVLLVKPTTYYNDTGKAARKLIDFYELDPATDLLVLHDDLALPLGTIRTRGQGSDAGNNGIKSLNAHIGPDYHRIRIGIWNELSGRMDAADFVLSKFSKDESEIIKTSITPHCITAITQFISGDLSITSHTV